jgi:hypothetical protein
VIFFGWRCVPASLREQIWRGSSEFLACEGDFVPAALRERNFFGGEHDFPVMKVELGGEWS